MAYRDNSEPKFRPSSIDFDDWMLFSAATSVGLGLVMLLFHLLAWVAGWPGPFLWFGSANRLADILAASGIATVMVFIMNIFGAVGFMAVTALVTRIRGRS